MNWAHLHLVLNHAPVLGTIFGLALLAYGIAKRSDAIEKAALAVFVVVAVLALPVYFTGEPAEEVVERTAGLSPDAIEAHEAAALIAMIGVGLLGIVSLGALVAARGGRLLSTKATRAAVVVAFVTTALMARTANLGGRIHHQEIRAGAPAPAEQEADEGR